MPPWGTTTLVDSVAQHPGGNAATSSYALGKLGAPVRLAGAVGDDAFGQYVLARLRSAGVDASAVRIAPGAQTATTVGLINPRSERLRFDAPGFSYFHFASVFNMPRLRRGGPALLARARPAGLFTSVDTMWDTTGRWMEDFAAFCPHLDCLFLNQDEADAGRLGRSRRGGAVLPTARRRARPLPCLPWRSRPSTPPAPATPSAERSWPRSAGDSRSATPPASPAPSPPIASSK